MARQQPTRMRANQRTNAACGGTGAKASRSPVTPRRLWSRHEAGADEAWWMHIGP